MPHPETVTDHHERVLPLPKLGHVSKSPATLNVLPKESMNVNGEIIFALKVDIVNLFF